MDLSICSKSAMAQLPKETPYQPLPTVVDYVSPAAPPFAQQLAIRRRLWYKHWFCCCGECDELGWGTCLLGSFCPCVAFGLNRNRGFGQSALLWGALFLFLMILSGNVCKSYIIWGNGESDEPSDIECVGLLPSLFSFQVVMSSGLVGAIALIVIGVMNRTSLRNKFALEGHTCTDCLLWTFCTPCALCQETRTLWYNSVTDGVWRGPPQAYVPPLAQGAPGMATSSVIGQQTYQVSGAATGVPIVTAAPFEQQVYTGCEAPSNTKDPTSGYPQVLPTV